jgi:hypothetical protein
MPNIALAPARLESGWLMSISWQYPRWQRILMQVTLWLALAGTTVAAALLSHQRQRELAAMSPGQFTVGGLTLKLPVGWAVERSAADGSDVLIVAREAAGTDSDDSEGGRSLIVRLVPDQHAATPREFLQRNGMLREGLEVNGGEVKPPEDVPVQPQAPATAAGRECTVAGVTGALVKVYRLGGSGDGDDQPTRFAEWIACGLVGGGRAVLLQLDCPSEDATDAGGALLTVIAANVRVSAVQAPTPPRGAPPL